MPGRLHVDRIAGVWVICHETLIRPVKYEIRRTEFTATRLTVYTEHIGGDKTIRYATSSYVGVHIVVKTFKRIFYFIDSWFRSA